MNDLSNKLSSKSIIAKQELNQADLEKRQLDLVQALEANDSYLNSEEYTQAIAEYKQMEELEKKLFREANFVLSDGRKEKLNAEGYKQGKEYDIMNGNFYCRNKKLMEFIL